MSTPSKPSANPPLIHITLHPATVRVGVALIASAVLLSLGALGLASSPIVAGHPVLLTPERLAIKTYLDAATRWVQRLDAIDQQLSMIEVGAAVAPKVAAHLYRDHGQPDRHRRGPRHHRAARHSAAHVGSTRELA